MDSVRRECGLAENLGRVTLVVLLLLAPVSLSAQEEAEWYHGKPIQDIIFAGLEHIKIGDLEGIYKPYIGRTYSDELFLELQGRLYSLEYFDLISPSAVRADDTGTAVILKFTVTERPIVARIKYVGNSGVRNNELTDVISTKANDVYNQVKIRLDEAAIRDKYLEKGYPDVRVSTESQNLGEGAIALTFKIIEGEQVVIEAFRFEGNNTFSERTLRGQLSLKVKGFLVDGAFQEAKLLADRETLVQYYHNRGYIDAEVLDVVREIRKDEKGANLMTLVFKISEGRLYTFGGVTFVGNEIFSTETLLKQVNSVVGQVVNERNLEADMARVADLYFESGYIFNTINREVNRDSDAGTISYTIYIIERGRAHIEDIIINGNEKTRESVIRREIPLEPGDIFSRTKVLEAMRNLYNLQYFSNVTPEFPQGSADSLMNLVFTVEEQPTTDIQLGFTFSGTTDPDTFPISGLFKWNDRNFLGYGNIIGIELNASPDTQYLTLEYTQRWLFGLPLAGGFDFTVRHSERSAAMDNYAPFFNGDETYAFPDGFENYEEYVNDSRTPSSEYLMTYDQWSFSLGFSTGYRFSTPLGSLTLGGGIRTGLVRNLYDSTLYRPFDPTLRSYNDQWVLADSFSLNLSLDGRDLYYDPSKGYYFSQRAGYYGFFDFEKEFYIRTDSKAEFFLTVFDIPITETYNLKMVLGLHTGLSFILPQPGRGDTPTILSSNSLSVDGMFTGRGWTERRLDRGLALWENWAELRMPLVPGVLALDMFFDAAIVQQTPQQFFSDFDWEAMCFSFGAGLRFAIPQFPFRLFLVKRFRLEGGNVVWEKGIIGDDQIWSVDPVFTFVISTY